MIKMYALRGETDKIMKKISLILNSNKVSGIFLLVAVSLSVFIGFATVLLQNAGRASAQVSSFYSTSCLGGWKNTDKAAGAPEVTEGGVEQYIDANSASISNTIAEIFCGGFKGEIPTDTFQKKIILKFSWAVKNPSLEAGGETITNTISSINDMSGADGSANAAAVIMTGEQLLKPEEELLTSESVTEIGTPAESIVPPVAPEPTSEISPESAAAEEQTLINMIFSKAHAQEIIQEVNVEQNTTATTTSNNRATTTDDTTSEIEPIVPSGALLEVLYTLDGSNWNSIGYVSNITNDVSFKMPMDIFTTTADLARVQIAIRTVPTFDSMPTIYLDSVWLEVEYQKIPVTKGISGFKVFVLTQDTLELTLNNWFSAQVGIVVDDLKVENYGEGGYLVIVSYHMGGAGNSSTRFKLIVGENPEVEAQIFLSSLAASQTVRSITATTGFYSGPQTTVIVPMIFIVYE